jgi:hypothetical protein
LRHPWSIPQQENPRISAALIIDRPGHLPPGAPPILERPLPPNRNCQSATDPRLAHRSLRGVASDCRNCSGRSFGQMPRFATCSTRCIGATRAASFCCGRPESD